MTTCRPASQFCCGCSVKFGVTLILVLHLLECLWVTVMTGVFVIGRSSTLFQFAFADLGTQTAFAIFALAGIPIIIVALWGVRHGVETCLRLYLFYAVLSFIIDAVYCLYHFVFHHTCDALPNIFAEQGHAWACGIARVFDAASLVVMLGIPAYFIFVVYSYCEDMTEGGAGPDLSDLTTIGKRHRQLRSANDPYSSVLGMSKWVDGEYGTVYHSESTKPHGLGGGMPILGGSYHEMAYPPPPSTGLYYWKR